MFLSKLEPALDKEITKQNSAPILRKQNLFYTINA